MSDVGTMHFSFPACLIPKSFLQRLSRKSRHYHHHRKHKPSMSPGRDRDNPIDLDDGGSDSDIQVYSPRRQRHAKDPVTKRAPASRDSPLKEPQPTLRASLPLAREPHLLDKDTSRSKHRKRHRERQTGHERRHSKHHDPAPELYESMHAHVPAEGQAGLLLLDPQSERPGDPMNVQDAVLDAPYHLPDLGLGEDPGLDVGFWGEFLANEPLGQFPDQGDLEQESLGQGVRDQWNELFAVEDENFNRRFPRDYLPFGQAPVGKNQDTNESVSLDPTRSTDDDVEYVREVAVSVDDQVQEDSCLAKILEVFPDISQDHVRTLYQEHRAQDFKYSAIRDDRAHYDPSEVLIQQIIEKPSYPKQRDTKRKRPVSPNVSQEDDEKWGVDAGPRDKLYLSTARTILQEEFPQVPHSFIKEQLAEKRSLYLVYLTVAEAECSFGITSRLYDRLKNPRKSKLFPKAKEDENMAEKNYRTYGPAELLRELQAARIARKKEEKLVQAKKDAEEAEVLNEQEHIEASAMMTCQCCFDDAPINRTVHCDGEDPHFFCFACVKTHASTEIGKMHYKLKCMDGSICTGIFSMPQLIRCLDQKTLSALERLQQQEEIRLAGFEGLAECPFCDYKAICPPVETDREFRCGNPECERVSCRLCEEETHVPKSCEENKKERHLPARHAIEEAMTEALIRTCPKCKAKIVKEAGCNKMTCTRCYALMCYICRIDITTEQYNHFNKAGSKCQVYDQNTEKLHNDDVAAAEKKALEKAKEENPDIPEEELKIKMKEDPKKPTHPLTARMMRDPIEAMEAQRNMMRGMQPLRMERAGYVAQHRQAVGVHGPPYVPIAPRGAQDYRGVDRMPEPLQFQQNQQFPGQAPVDLGHPPPPGARGRFPVVPFVPGRFGDMIHDPPLGQMWDGYQQPTQPMRGNVPPFAPLGPDPLFAREIARLQAEYGPDRVRNLHPHRNEYFARFLPGGPETVQQGLEQLNDALGIDAHEQRHQNQLNELPGGLAAEWERPRERLGMDIASQRERFQDLANRPLTERLARLNQDQVNREIEALVPARHEGGFQGNMYQPHRDIHGANAAEVRAAEARLGLRRAQTERVPRRRL